MSRFLDWLEDYYIYIAMGVILAFFAFGGIASLCDKRDNEIVQHGQYETYQNRTAFYEKYCEDMPQFDSPVAFSVWLNSANFETMCVFYDLIVEKYGVFAEEDGFDAMIEYLGWIQPDKAYSYE